MQPDHTVQCLLVDDEPIARRIIKNHLAKVEGFTLVGECGTALECFTVLQSQQVDLMFLDIQMPQITGLEFLRSLHHPPKVIIVSAYREYAVEGFELDVVDYLLKPVSFERILKALDKYRQSHTGLAKKMSAENVLDHIYIRVDRKTVRLLLKDVKFIESLSDYLKVHTKNSILLTKEKISVIEQKLPAYFLRIHRSFILNTHYLEAFNHEFVEVDGKQLPISRSFKRDVLDKLGR